MKYLTLLLLALLPIPLPAIVLELRAQQSLGGNNLTLNDVIVSSQGVSADDLNAILGPTPSLGNQETWNRDQIAAALPESLRTQPIEWQGATECVVMRPCINYKPEDVRQVITAELGRRLPPNSEFTVLELPDLQAFPVPAGQLETRVELAPNTMRTEWGNATLEFSVEGQLAVTRNIRFHWSYTRMVWQAVSLVNPGDTLTASSFQQVETNVLKIPGQIDPASDFPEGKAAAHALGQGNILMQNDWVEPILVKRSDLVTILYNHHGVSITVEAQAMSNGVRNQVIAVQNLTSHKIFNARVVDERSLVYDE